MTVDPLIEAQRIASDYLFEAGRRKGRRDCRAGHERPGFWVRVGAAAVLLAGVAWWGRRR